MQYRVIVAILLACLLLAGCCSSAGRPAAVSPTQAAKAEATASKPTATPQQAEARPGPTATVARTAPPAPTITPKPVAAGLSRSNPLPLGTEVKGENWSIIVTSVIRGSEAAQMIAQANMFNEPPRQGYEYLIANIKLTNISTKEKAQSTLFAASLRVTGDRNVVYSPASVVAPKEFKGELFPKGTAEGQEVFEVPNGEKNLQFIVSEMMSFDAEARRFLAIDEQAKIVPDTSLRSIRPTDKGKQRANPAKIGGTLVAGSWEFTILEATRGDEAARMVAQANQFNDPAPDGQEYIAIRLKARFLGTADPDHAENIDTSYLKITGERNVVYEWPSAVEPKPALDATLFAGGETEGWVVLSAGKGEKGLLLIFKPLLSFSSDDTRYIAIE